MGNLKRCFFLLLFSLIRVSSAGIFNGVKPNQITPENSYRARKALFLPSIAA
uniref:Uncharacterized protein n=1 Tax=Meloidogyne enterolobii TaxID=390850 RepID=A0A6V7U2D3_MELEN|nr:unnamed protein product [Meloidogyne enterolobii]